ncbi:MAG: cation diffusion facilitator family transporter [Chloroflexi bacterium]|nr:cation diffusion facilitator family transporter [Chloroflexota bacterium]
MAHRHSHDHHGDDHHGDGHADSPSRLVTTEHTPAGHGHDHGPATYNLAFAVGVALNVTFVVIEVTFGVLSNSLALVADAGHNLSDVLALLLAWGAVALGQRQPTQRRTYGWRRSSILAALVNAVTLLVVVGGVTWEAVRRFAEPTAVEGGTVIGVAAVGILVNAGTALMFMAGRKKDVNMGGVVLHMASDAGVSLGVVLAGFAILATGWAWLDPAISLLIGFVILVGTWGLLKDSLNLAMDAVPEGVEITAVKDYLSSLPSVSEVHDLHVWGMSTTEVALTAHLVIREPWPDDGFLTEIAGELREEFNIAHPTLQFERGDPQHPCLLAPSHVV